MQRQLDENRELAERDALTRVANRYRLESALQRECQRAQRFRQPLSLIAMDMDDFKPINDRYGHARGDSALVRVAENLRTCLRELDLLARSGIQLGGVSVGAQQQGQGQPGQPGEPGSQAGTRGARAPAASDAGAAASVQAPAQPRPRSDGSQPLDMFV